MPRGGVGVVNLGQVVAAMAAGALLTISITLVLQLHGRRRHEETDIQKHGDDNRELEIETAAQMIEDSFDVLQRTTGGRKPPDPGDDGDGDLPRGAVVVRSKGHLRLISSAVAALVTASTAARDAVRTSHGQVVSATVSAAAAASAVTALVLTPWAANDDSQSPAPAESSTAWTTSPRRGTLAPQPARAEPSSSPTFSSQSPEAPGALTPASVKARSASASEGWMPPGLAKKSLGPVTEFTSAPSAEASPSKPGRRLGRRGASKPPAAHRTPPGHQHETWTSPPGYAQQP